MQEAVQQELPNGPADFERSIILVGCCAVVVVVVAVVVFYFVSFCCCLFLHATLTVVMQFFVFQSTDVTESSITIPGVVFVLNAGLQKIKVA
jgi:hypothetical protein